MMGRENLWQVDDALEYVRSRPEMFFEGGTFKADEMALLLVREALQWGVPSVEVIRAGKWIIVHSPADWLDEEASASFQRLIAFPAGGQNAMRMEVLTTAFAEAVITKAKGKVERIVGATDTSVLAAYAERGRAVAFLAAESPNSPDR